MLIVLRVKEIPPDSSGGNFFKISILFMLPLTEPRFIKKAALLRQPRLQQSLDCLPFIYFLIHL